ncbi:hypothetical protein KIW84_055608 [Lathyrus oleraceus]|uniref:Uncharacterized protein n=1 Tax=Pisum sativum TaxID=3888 RepID=A0A9D4WZ32_PEA|nr:hypothetical protein KIW84_055608 [Pisum sativum]
MSILNTWYRPWYQSKREWHTRETCWKLKGKPRIWKKKSGRAFQASNSDHGHKPPPSQFPLTTEQLDRLYKLLESPTPSCSIATKGNSAFLSVIPNHTRIVDSGVSDHMTCESTLFSSYSPCAVFPLQTIFNQNPNFFQSPKWKLQAKPLKEACVSIKTTTTKIKVPKKISELPPFTTLSAPLAVGNQQYMLEPKTEEQRIIYVSQVLIPVSVFGKNHALSRPLADLDIDSSKLRELFPSYHKCKPIRQAKNPRIGTTTIENPKASDVIDLRFDA